MAALLSTGARAERSAHAWGLRSLHTANARDSAAPCALDDASISLEQICKSQDQAMGKEAQVKFFRGISSAALDSVRGDAKASSRDGPSELLAPSSRSYSVTLLQPTHAGEETAEEKAEKVKDRTEQLCIVGQRFTEPTSN